MRAKRLLVSQTCFRSMRSGIRAQTKMMVLATIAAIASSSPAMAQLEHGFGATKVCNPRCEGEAMDCTMTGRHLDDFDDVTVLSEAWDEVSTGLGLVRIPAVGNLPIISVVGNAVCTNSGGVCVPATGLHCALPCRLGRSGSNAGGMPGLTPAGRVQFKQNQYIIKPTDPGDMPDTVMFAWTDECNDLVGSTSCPIGTLVTPAGSNTDVIRCNDGDPCTTDCCLAGVCSSTSVCQDTSCGAGNTPLSCDDHDVCTSDSCNDENAPTCCSNTPIPCPDVPCMRNTGCDPVAGCQYEFDCREPGKNCCRKGGECDTAVCNKKTGQCSLIPDCRTDTDCNDHDECTADDCTAEGCCENTPIPCPDRACYTHNGCDPVLGCQYRTVCQEPGYCNDSNVCTRDVCDETADGCCKYVDIPCEERPCFRITGCDPVNGCIYESICSFNPSYCDDHDVCTADSCDDQADGCCKYTPNTCPPVACKRGTGCDPVLGCQYEFDCRAPGANCCPDNGGQCSAASCDQATGQCTSTPDCSVDHDCKDTNLCTRDVCNAQGCCEHPPLDCNDNNTCTTDSCNPQTGCVHTPQCHTAADCASDSDPCTVAVCVEGCCSQKPKSCCGNGTLESGETCDPPGSVVDGRTCRAGCTYCGDGIVNGGEQCDDGNNVNTDSCSNECTSTNTCDDGNPCTQDSCVCSNHHDDGDDDDDGHAASSNTDGSGKQYSRPASLSAHAGSSNETSSSQSHHDDDDGDDDDDDHDSGGGQQCVCPAGACDDEGHAAKGDDDDDGDHNNPPSCVCIHKLVCTSECCGNCDDGNPCTEDYCAPGSGHTTANGGGGYDDDDDDSSGDTCVCKHRAKCDDHNACTQNVCTAGVCTYPPINCHDQNECTTDWCDSNYGCKHTPECYTDSDCGSVSKPCVQVHCQSGCCVEQSSSSCCGNGHKEPGETCDPPGSIQWNGKTCRDNCTYCGDHIVNSGEQCDDGNSNSYDSCSNGCYRRY